MHFSLVLYEAQQAFFYGLPENLALASVISTPARVAGLDHRVGYVKRGLSTCRM
jgi:imidazolonepropionase-like amidohydrolase